MRGKLFSFTSSGVRRIPIVTNVPVANIRPVCCVWEGRFRGQMTRTPIRHASFLGSFTVLEIHNTCFFFFFLPFSSGSNGEKWGTQAGSSYTIGTFVSLYHVGKLSWGTFCISVIYRWERKGNEASNVLRFPIVKNATAAKTSYALMKIQHEFWLHLYVFPRFYIIRMRLVNSRACSLLECR